MAGIIGTPRETYPRERRVSLAPRQCEVLVKAGLEVIIEASAGVEAGFPDEAYLGRGARVGSREDVFRQAGIIAQVRSLGANPDSGRSDLALLRPGQIVIGFSEPLSSLAECSDLAAAGVSLLALELIPRITRAQSMDALSSMATIAGYRAVLLGASELPKMFPLMMTAAGTVTPAKVFVLGAGVAGLWPALLTIGFAAPLGYAAGVLAVSATAAGRLRGRALAFLPVVLGTMHICWGTGFLTSPRRLVPSGVLAPPDRSASGRLS